MILFENNIIILLFSWIMFIVMPSSCFYHDYCEIKRKIFFNNYCYTRDRRAEGSCGGWEWVWASFGYSDLFQAAPCHCLSLVYMYTIHIKYVVPNLLNFSFNSEFQSFFFHFTYTTQQGTLSCLDSILFLSKYRIHIYIRRQRWEKIILYVDSKCSFHVCSLHH